MKAFLKRKPDWLFFRLVGFLTLLLVSNFFFSYKINNLNQFQLSKNTDWINFLSEVNHINTSSTDIFNLLEQNYLNLNEKQKNKLNLYLQNVEINKKKILTMMNELNLNQLHHDRMNGYFNLIDNLNQYIQNDYLKLKMNNSTLRKIDENINVQFTDLVENLKSQRQLVVLQHSDEQRKYVYWQNFANIVLIGIILYFIYYGFRIAVIVGRVQRRKVLVKKINSILLTNQQNSDMIEEVLEVMCKHFGWKLAVYWNYENQFLHSTHQWAINHQIKSLSEGLWNIENAENLRTFQKIFRKKDALWVRDLFKEMTDERSSIIRRAELRSQIVFPIIVNDEILGVIELFNNRVEIVDNVYLEECSQIGMHIGEVIKRNKTESELKEALSIAANKQHAIDMSAIVGITDIHGKITYVNDKFCEVTGYSREELIGEDHRLLNSGFHPKDFFALMWETILDGRVWRGEIKNKRKDGTFYWSDSTIVPMRDARGKISQFIAIRYDITDSKSNQEQLLKAKEVAESAAKVKSDFLANMSHEIRTPMNAIIGMTDLLIETNLTDEQKRYVDIFKKAGKNLLNIINDILDSAKIESGQFKIVKEEIDVTEIIEEVSDITSASAFQKGLNFICFFRDELEHHFLGDSLRIKQVLTNLLSNAIKFTAKGEVILSISYNHFNDRKGNLLFSVKDTGEGISADKLQILFKPFTQADSGVTKKFGGTGLGLSLSKHLVEMMGGEMWVESHENQGSEFFFTVHFQQLAQPTKYLNVDLPTLKDKKVLIVDHSDLNRLMMRQYLEHLQMFVDEASNFEFAVQKLTEISTKNDFYHFTFIDYRLKGHQDGIELTRYIKNLTSRTRNVLLSFDGIPIYRSKYSENGINGLMYKPFKKSDLHQLLKEFEEVKTQTIKQSDVTEFLESQLPQAIEARPLQILLVDDSDDNRTLVKSFLKRSPHKITEVTNGEKAVHLFEEVKFDIILMDIQMPVMDGYQATKKIRELEKIYGFQRTPIIALTAYALKEDYERCLAVGCDTHVSKPVKKQILLDVINTYTKNQLKNEVA